MTMDIRGRTTPALNMVLFSIVFPHVPECFVFICVIQGFFVPGHRNAANRDIVPIMNGEACTQNERTTTIPKLFDRSWN
jgi:hypothetical protein